VRKRVQHLADRIQEAIGPFGYRAFVDSAPVLEKALARTGRPGLDRQEHLLLNRKAGSYFFLAELFVDLPLPVDGHHQRTLRPLPGLPGHLPDPGVRRALCAGCAALHFLPDHRAEGAIPVELRPLIGNRVFGCDDCQIVCPWNRFAKTPPRMTSSGTAWTTPNWPSCSCGMKSASSAAPKARRCGARV
jgi:epoxyqueuosine reductase